MLEWIKFLAEMSARVLEIVGIGIIVLGALSAEQTSLPRSPWSRTITMWACWISL